MFVKDDVNRLCNKPNALYGYYTKLQAVQQAVGLLLGAAISLRRTISWIRPRTRLRHRPANLSGSKGCFLHLIIRMLI